MHQSWETITGPGEGRHAIIRPLALWLLSYLAVVDGGGKEVEELVRPFTGLTVVRIRQRECRPQVAQHSRQLCPSQKQASLN